MQKLLFVILCAGIVGCTTGTTELTTQQKEEMQGKVEQFVESYIGYYESVNVNKFMNCFSKDALLMIHNKPGTLEEIEANLTKVKDHKDKNKDYSISCEVEILDVVIQTSYLASVSFYTHTLVNNKWRYKEGETLLLKKVNNNWKIAVAHMSSEVNPMIFGVNVNDDLKSYEINTYKRFRRAKYHLYLFMIEGISQAKANGLSPEQYGKQMGERFAPGWNKDEGTKGFVKGYLVNLQAISDNVEVLELDSTILKARIDLLPKDVYTEDVTEDDFLQYMNSMSVVIGDYLWSNVHLKREGDYIFVTIDQKK